MSLVKSQPRVIGFNISFISFSKKNFPHPLKMKTQELKPSRKRLNNAEKQSILDFARKNKNYTHKELSLKYKVPKSTIGDILRCSSAIIEKKAAPAKNFVTQKFDDKIFEWFVLKS
ncbi:hypothetical protein DMUE_5731 [Dictyocoela muelleri]|nr:hypothetical protein DMUE_5731 [Dictyocoela muelleri]